MKYYVVKQSSKFFQKKSRTGRTGRTGRLSAGIPGSFSLPVSHTAEQQRQKLQAAVISQYFPSPFPRLFRHKKKTTLFEWSFLISLPLAVATLLFSAFDFAGLFIVPAVTQVLERTFFIKLFLQTAKSTLDRFAFLYANLGVHNFHPLSNTVKGFIFLYTLCFFKQQIFYSAE